MTGKHPPNRYRQIYGKLYRNLLCQTNRDAEKHTNLNTEWLYNTVPVDRVAPIGDDLLFFGLGYFWVTMFSFS